MYVKCTAGLGSLEVVWAITIALCQPKLFTLSVFHSHVHALLDTVHESAVKYHVESIYDFKVDSYYFHVLTLYEMLTFHRIASFHVESIGYFICSYTL